MEEISNIDFDVTEPKNTTKLLELIQTEVGKCAEFFYSHEEFTDMEAHVHEMRRKLRWISIYAQSLSGLVALYNPRRDYGWESKFITQAEIKSPFNKLPAGDPKIFMAKKPFLALSFLIRRLGEIKDGAGNKYESQSVKAAQMKEAFKMCKTFFDSGIHIDLFDTV